PSLDTAKECGGRVLKIVAAIKPAAVPSGGTGISSSFARSSSAGCGRQSEPHRAVWNGSQPDSSLTEDQKESSAAPPRHWTTNLPHSGRSVLTVPERPREQLAP